MKLFYELWHNFNCDSLEIRHDLPVDLSMKCIGANSKEKMPDGIVFSVATGNKAYDIIRFFERCEFLYSQRIIDVFSKYIDMSDKCYPIIIKNVDMPYYVIFNLSDVAYLNEKENIYIKEPTFIDAQKINVPLFCIRNTGSIIVTEEIKNELLYNKLTNISLEECYSCSREVYERIKKTGVWPEVRIYEDRLKNIITTKYYRL